MKTCSSIRVGERCRDRREGKLLTRTERRMRLPAYFPTKADIVEALKIVLDGGKQITDDSTKTEFTKTKLI